MTFKSTKSDLLESSLHVLTLYKANNASLLKQVLNDGNREEFLTESTESFCTIGENVGNLGDPSFTDGTFRCLMLQKCGINQKKFDELLKYYRINKISDRKCYNQLLQFQRDLEDGNFHAQQMCDSWGEDIDFRNWPGLQFQLSVMETLNPTSYRFGVFNPVDLRNRHT